MRRAKGSVYRPSVVRTVRGRRVRKPTKFYWASYRDNAGERQCHVLKLPGGQRVTDKDVARSELDKILNRQERLAAGMIDPFMESAGMPIRKVLADYIRHLRRKRKGRRHIEQVLACLKWIIDRTSMARLADFNEDRIDKALGMVADKGRAARTINVYRNCVLPG